MNKWIFVALVAIIAMAAGDYFMEKYSQDKSYTRGYEEGYEQGKFDQSITCLDDVPYGYPMMGMNGIMVVVGEHLKTGQPMVMMVCPEEEESEPVPQITPVAGSTSQEEITHSKK